jgi:hypothetical protein
MTADQKIARRAAVRELGQDFSDRGGYEPFIGDDVVIEDQPCALHSVPVGGKSNEESLQMIDPPLPRRGQDERLVHEALDAGCHVFVTADKKILRCHRSLFSMGLALLSPAQLLEELDETGELDDCDTPLESPAPDLSALGRFYGGFASDCFGQFDDD